MIGLEYICSTYGISYSDLARAIKTTPQNINTWLNYGKSKSGRKISDERLKQLSDYFDLPEHLFQKELDPIEQLKISLQFNSNIAFDDMPYNVTELAMLHNEFADSVSVILNYTIFNEATPEGFEPRVQDIAEYHVFSKHKIDGILANHELDIYQKSDILETIDNVLSMIVDSIDSEFTSETIDKLDQLVQKYFEGLAN